MVVILDTLSMPIDFEFKRSGLRVRVRVGIGIGDRNGLG